ncbi:hypothetical protein ACJJTC_005358 [Scirpophaga incertulas]
MAYQYSNVEYTEMVRMLARCDDNVSEACRQYAIRFPNLRTPSHVTMLAATQRLRDYGQFRANTMRDSGRPPTHTVREQEDILDFFEIYPAASTNDAASRFNVTQYFAWSVIHGEGKYPFHFHRAQELTEPDKPARAAFCNWREIVLSDRYRCTALGWRAAEAGAAALCQCTRGVRQNK